VVIAVVRTIGRRSRGEVKRFRSPRDRQGQRRVVNPRSRETMKVIFMLRVSSMVLSLGIGTAYAGDGDGQSAATLFTSVQAQQQATIQAHRQADPVRVAAAQNGGAAPQAGARAPSVGTSLFSVFSLP
jgi:hypothetical protein